jgi:hypothetical protein
MSRSSWDLNAKRLIRTERANNAQILVNKVSSFMTNSIARKSRLLQDSQALINGLKANEAKVSNALAGLEKSKIELVIIANRLDVNSAALFKSIQECEIINNISHKCDETSDLYKSVLSAYEKQTESLQIYIILFRNKLKKCNKAYKLI